MDENKVTLVNRPAFDDLLKERDQLREENEHQRERIADLTAERDYLDGRCAEFEHFARDFIELEYDNVLRERLEKILYNEKEMK